MTIEAKLDRIIELLEAGAGAPAAAKQAAEEKKSANKGAEAAKAAAGKGKKKAATMDDVREAARVFMDELGGTKDQAKAILKDLGAAKLDQLDESKYQDAIDAFNAGPASDEDNEELL